ncbi:angiomotin-like [Ixodes scapularis]|uniref:angiomotin-like n=1 Tax=Ixodes scapularis TaxID=6945 RepID=UPI001C38CE7A|nr:angiomotin-like [Ixodes scapularis]
MPTSCVAFGCRSWHRPGDKKSYFRFPSKKLFPHRRAAWIRAVKRVLPSDPNKAWEPSKESRICEDHFVTGEPSLDNSHPDYVPTVFTYVKNRPSVLGRYERWKHRLSTGAAVKKRIVAQITAPVPASTQHGAPQPAAGSSPAAARPSTAAARPSTAAAGLSTAAARPSPAAAGPSAAAARPSAAAARPSASAARPSAAAVRPSAAAARPSAAAARPSAAAAGPSAAATRPCVAAARPSATAGPSTAAAAGPSRAAIQLVAQARASLVVDPLTGETSIPEHCPPLLDNGHGAQTSTPCVQQTIEEIEHEDNLGQSVMSGTHDGCRLKIAQMQQRILSLEADNMRLQVELQHHETRRLSVDFIRHDPKQCIYYTGLPEFAVFEAVYDFFAPRASQMQYWSSGRKSSGMKGRPRELELIEEFFMVLTRLRTGMAGREMARNFGVHEATKAARAANARGGRCTLPPGG